jgi:[protein-PII] uridylyltransferase
VLWIARAAGLGRTWRELAQAGLITRQEARTVSRQEGFIGGLRVRLHYLSGRREDRLIFDQQNALARELGLVDMPAKGASEQLMQRYYRAAKLLRQVNVILLQNLHARLFPLATEPVAIDDTFQSIDELLDIRDEALFERQPAAMLDAFLTMERHPELRGMSARTLRSLWRNRHRVDALSPRPGESRSFHPAAPRAARRTHELRRMNLYGILGNLVPAFGRIVGQMQRPLPRLHRGRAHPDGDPQPSPVHRAAARARISSVLATDRDFDRREVLYLAALFHDIAKGRGGDHSTLGAVDARRFCRAHGLPADEVELVAWLVAQHLSMSATAQKQDVSDPDVIAAFAARVGNERRLVALYLLTVADIRGTSPRVWNAWKAQLLEDLFYATRARLAEAAGGATLADSLLARQREARRLLRLYAVPEGAEDALWSELDNVYFQRQTADEIAWHARQLHWRVLGTAPVARAFHAPKPACRSPCTCPTRRTCSRESAAFSVAGDCRSSKRRSIRRATATRSTPSASTIRRIRRPPAATRSSSSSSSSRKC